MTVKFRHSTLFPIACQVIACILTMLPGYSIGQEKLAVPGNHKAPILEYPGGSYIPSPREEHAKSPAFRFSAPGFTVTQVNVDEDGMNIIGDAANEPSITFDPNDPNRMAIGWRQFDNINNSFRQAGFGYTTDAGQSWTFPGIIDPGVFRSDPVLGCDAEGNFYYNSLTVSGDSYWCNVYRSEDGGGTWGMGTYAQGGDKQWMSIDRTSGIGKGNIYEFWSPAASICDPHYFTRSTDDNLSYEDCSNVPGDPYWGTTIVGPDGALYAAGWSWTGFMIARSSNAQDPGQAVNWDMTTPVNLDGEIIGFGGYDCPNPVGLLGQTIIAMDTSSGPGNGNLYMLCSVNRYSTPDQCDVMFARSTDGGLSWDLPKRINDDPGTSAWQWFGTMSVAPDGRIDVIWLDTRDNPGQVLSSLYYSYSLDQGETWTDNIRLTEAFDPHIGWPQQEKIGDYFDMYSDDAGAHLAWAATFNGEQDVYYSLITPEYVGIADHQDQFPSRISRVYPNPVTGYATIMFNLAEKCPVSLKIFTMSGSEVADLLNESRDAGTSRYILDASRLVNGTYYYRLQAGNHTETGKIIVIR